MKTNETQEIDAGALRARLAETPADLRGRIEAALRARHGADGVRVWTWRTQHDPEQHCAACGIPGWRTAPTVAPYATAAAALAALAVAVGLNADGSDPRAEVERLRAESERRSELLDDVAHAHERDVLTIWAALGETHEPPENVGAIVAVVARLKRTLETMPPWEFAARCPTDEEMRALRCRWATGPERYQGDADRLISAVLYYREALAEMTARCDRAHHAVRQYGPRCSHPECDDLAPYRCEDCGRRFCEAHDDGRAGHDPAAGPQPHAVGPDDLRAGSAMREAGSR